MDVSDFFANDSRAADKAQEAYQESIEEVYRNTPNGGPFSNWDGVDLLWRMYLGDGKTESRYVDWAMEVLTDVYRATPNGGPFSNWDGVLRLWDMYRADPDFDSFYDDFPSWAQAELRK